MTVLSRQNVSPETIRTLVRESAAEAHAQHRQYDGHWDGDEWFVVEFKRKVETKMGVAFEQGDLTIARRLKDSQEQAELGDSICAYSVRNRVDTWVPASFVREMKDA
jgi:hypothetical protein